MLWLHLCPTHLPTRLPPSRAALQTHHTCLPPGPLPTAMPACLAFATHTPLPSSYLREQWRAFAFSCLNKGAHGARRQLVLVLEEEDKDMALFKSASTLHFFFLPFYFVAPAEKAGGFALPQEHVTLLLPHGNFDLGSSCCTHGQTLGRTTTSPSGYFYLPLPCIS